MLNVKVFLFVAMTTEVKDGCALDKSILDVSFSGSHHLYSEVPSELLFLDDIDELVILDLVTYLALSRYDL